MDPEEHARIVKNGYDRIAEEYNKKRGIFDDSDQIEEFISYLPEKGVVLDIGCGGGPILKILAQRGFVVKGIDFSKGMLEIARRNVPEAELFFGDVTKTEFENASFDGIISTYALIHIHRDLHFELYKKMHRWLRPGGINLVGTARDDWSGDEKYFGVRMVWNHAGASDSLNLVKKAGFSVLFAKNLTSGGETHFWILARK
ncbi:MAG: class I SAM-dependent methyltransferase [Candidatus Thorarchaeota archaeon]|nr:class I SAM-dependent methyltransferase [Candidatus Thorarchaeota archaeon]